jgi:hypothetical protein
MPPLLCSGVSLRLIAYYWGLCGVVGLIASAVWRLTPRIVELTDASLGLLHWLVLAVFTPYMAYAEGYKGFHLNFAPRVVARAWYLRDMQSPGSLQGFLLTLLAPAFCMGYFHATRRRMLVSWLVSSAIVALVIAVSHTPQPWRGIVDAGVVTGLGMGIASLLWHWQRAWRGIKPEVPLDLPLSGPAA